ncbi:IniB N-terminal domain-containing protein [Pseudonocardia sp. GCM10023141]|uniref:IniB N-terminal domain-containing protein n=1 Tax=Pseudonocardia sp. GCM10023141 TaxID=3252653 RepID=UPI003605BE29
MAEPLTLLEFVKELLTDGHLREWFAENPHAALNQYGLGHLTPADVSDALVLVQDSQTADFSRDYHTGDNGIGSWAAPAHDGGGHAAGGIEYVDNYVTHNFVNDHDTIIDQSRNQNFDTHGGDFYQDLDNHSVTASGDGSVATAGDIRNSDVLTGSGNTLGNGNVAGNGNVVGNNNHAVNGSDNTTSFGSGDAGSTSIHGPLDIGHGAAFNSGGGDALVDNSDNSLHNVGNALTDNSQVGSHNSAVDASAHDSGNDTSDNSHEESTHTHDSFNTDVDSSTHSTDTQHDSHNFDHHV